MEQAFAGAAVGATIQVLLQPILSKSMKEIINVWGFEKDLAKLKNSLLMIQDFLSDAEALSDNNRDDVKRWLHNLEDVAFEADAVLDEFNYELLRQQVENKNRETKKVTKFFSSVSSSLLFRPKMVKRIRDVNKQLESINKEAKGFGLGMTVGGSHNSSLAGSVRPAEEQTDIFTMKPNFIGREKELTDIVERLVTTPNDQMFSVVPIVGMGGLGKTTLAEKVFKHEKIQSHFQKRIWVCVSQHLDATFKMILQALTSENVQGIMRRTDVLEKIREHLAGKKYLLVLDDVWNDDVDRWEDFLKSLSAISSVNGNGIVVTTRKLTVALPFETLPTHQLDRLTDDDCWSIIKSKALSGLSHPTEFEDIGKCLAQNCGGVPLAANIIGGMLYGKSKDEWLSILKNDLAYLVQDNNIASKLLKLSFDRLPSVSLKKCFAYCSVFPRDYLIRRDQLIQLWMAEGFLEPYQRGDMESVGNIYFDTLLQNSFLQQTEVDQYGNTSICRMPNVVYDMASLFAKSNNTHHSLMDEQNVNLQVRSEYLRTLFFYGKVEHHTFLAFKCLHVIKLTGVNVEELPTEIEKLIHLRFIDISDTQIKDLPDSVGKLYHLQTLRASQLEELPDTIINLLDLRHLHISSIELPPGIGNLTSLRTLRHYKVGHKMGCRIGELGKLGNLRGELRIENLEIVNDREEAKNADLFGKPNIWSLCLEWKEPRESETNDENVLEGLQPHPNLKSLKILGYRGKKFPLWIEKMRVQNDSQGFWETLSNLTKISLKNCDHCEKVPMLGHLPLLRKLKLNGLPNVRSIGLSFYGIEYCSAPGMTGSGSSQETAIAFPALEKLVLVNMQNLREWVDVEGANVAFPYLKYLRIWCCPKLKTVPSQFSSKELIID